MHRDGFSGRCVEMSDAVAEMEANVQNLSIIQRLTVFRENLTSEATMGNQNLSTTRAVGEESYNSPKASTKPLPSSERAGTRKQG